jgi:Glycosyltransferase Family 4
MRKVRHPRGTQPATSALLFSADPPRNALAASSPQRPSRRPPRVLLVADSLDVGGAERQVCELATALSARGYTAAIACSTDGALAGTLPASVPVHVLCDQLVKRRFSLPYAWALACLLRREAFDLVHAHMYASGQAAALALLGSAVPLVLTEHSEAVWRGRRAPLRQPLAVPASGASHCGLARDSPATRGAGWRTP